MQIRSLEVADPLERGGAQQPTRVFLPGNIMDRGADGATVHRLQRVGHY